MVLEEDFPADVLREIELRVSEYRARLVAQAARRLELERRGENVKTKRKMSVERAVLAYDLKLSGLTFVEIAEKIGPVSRERARQVVEKGRRLSLRSEPSSQKYG